MTDFDRISKKEGRGVPQPIGVPGVPEPAPDAFDGWPGKEVTIKDKLGGGVKADGEKSRVDLLDSDFLLAVGAVLAYGAKKYSEENWREGISVKRLIGAALRHLFAIMRGEDVDPETNLPHTAHLGCCVMFLHWTLKNKPLLDNRWRGV